MAVENSIDDPIVVPLEDLQDSKVNIVLAKFQDADSHSLGKPLREASDVAKAAGHYGRSNALNLLHDLNNIHMRADDRAEPFGPIFRTTEFRTCTASDFRGKQNDILAEFVEEIEHPVLRARVADIVWYNDRTKFNAGNTAIFAYCDTIEQRQSGQIHRTYGDDGRLFDLVDYLQRLLQITARLYKADGLPERVKSIFNSVYESAIIAQEYVVFCNLAEAGLGYGLLNWSKAVKDSEIILIKTGDDNYPQAIQAVWELAARGYERLQDEENKKRCQKEVVLLDLKMREQVGNLSMAQAHWVRVAIGKLRHFGGFRDWIADLRRELRELEEGSLDEFATYSYTLDLKDQAMGTIAVFEKLTLPDILLQFALLSQPVAKSKLKTDADASSKKFIAGNLFGNSYSDRDGKVIAQSGAKPSNSDPSEDWYKEQSLQYMQIYRKHVVGGSIEPARQNVMGRFPLEQRHFLPIVEHSPFVQPGYWHVFSLGFARFWQGDYASAAYFLIPQLENAIRYVLKNANAETAKIMSDLTQDDLSLSSLLSRMKAEIEDIFGEDLFNEIDILFNFRPGPALRHEMAHRKLSDGHCYDSNTIYGCWLIYHLTCLPLIKHWRNVIGPGIEANAF